MYRILFLLVLLSGCVAGKRQTKHLIKVGGGDTQVTDFFLTPGSELVYSAYNNKISVYNLSGSKLVSSFEYPDSVEIQTMVLSADSSLLVVGTRQGIVYVQNLLLNTRASFKPTDKQITSLAIDSSNTMIVCGTINGSVFIMDIEGELIRRMDSHKRLVSGLLFINNGQILVSSGLDGKVFLTYLNEQYYTVFISNKKSPCRSIAFDTASHTLLAAYDNGKIYKFTIKTGKQPFLLETKRITGWATDVASLNNSDVSAACSADGTIRIFIPFDQSYKYSFKSTVKQIQFLTNKQSSIYLLVSVEGKGLYILSALDMELK
jgi:outer membrane protein assembly factor BamB